MKISKKTKSIAISAVVLATAVLSWIGFGKIYPAAAEPQALPERIFRTLKALLGDPLGNAAEDRKLPWELIVAKLLATIILVAGVFKIIESVFFEYFTMLKVALKNRHTIVIGTGRKGSRILRDLKECQKSTAVAIEQDVENSNIRTLRGEGHVILNGDARESEILQQAGIRKAATVICFLADQQANLEVAKAAADLYSKEKIQNPLNFYLHLDNARLIEMMQGSDLLKNDKRGLNFRFFNTNRMIARSFFEQIPKEYAAEIRQNKKFRLLVFGMNETGTQLVLQALRVMHFPGKNVPEISIVDTDIEAKAKIFNEKYPMAQKISRINFKEFSGTFGSHLAEFSNDKNTEDVCILCFDEDEQNLGAALEILNMTPGESFRIFTQNNNSKGMNTLFRTGKKSRIRFFGNLDYVCRLELITREKQDTLAKAIHNDYLKIQRETAASESAAYKTPWEELGEDAKNANRAQADHISYKLAILGKDLDAPGNLDFSPEETELLAKTEHERWMAHRYINGWDFGEIRDDVRRLHPSIIPWEALPEPEKQKDRDTVLRLREILAAAGTPGN